MSAAEAFDRSSSSLMMRHSASQPQHLSRGAGGAGMTTLRRASLAAASATAAGGLVDWRAGDDNGGEGVPVSNFYDLGNPAAAASAEQQQRGGSLWTGGGESGSKGSPRTPLSFSVHPGASGRGTVAAGDRQLLASQV